MLATRAAAAVAFAVPLLARADLPIHCLASDAPGDWVFVVGPGSSERSSCRHLRPDDPQREPLVEPGAAWLGAEALRVTLGEGGDAASPEGHGSWRMVSDEALELRLGGREFLALFSFRPLPTDVGDEHLPTSVLRAHSRCNETMIGWYRSGDRSTWGCWHGARGSGVGTLLQEARTGVRRRLHHSRRFGGRLRGRLAADGGADGPAALDWRNASGQNWVDPPLKQGRCGSCYAIAAMQMLSARRRIAAGDAKLEAFSVAFPLLCGEYTEGCYGGYPYLAAKWGEDVGLLPERCMPYAEEGACAATCDAGERVRAANHRYIRGGEAAIVEALRQGPLAVSFRSDPALQGYATGLWSPPPIGDDDDAGSDGFVIPTHSALLVGYGEDAQEGPYWILQNAWGSDWGEGGSFRIGRQAARERGLEELVVAADVVPDERSGAVADALLVTSAPGVALLESSSRGHTAARAGASSQDHRGRPVCRMAPEGPDSEQVVVRIDAEHNFRGLSFGDSAGTETAVRCAGATPGGCPSAVAEGAELPDCAAVPPCPCDLHGQELPFPGMTALAEKVVLMCSSAPEPVRVLMVGLGGGAISSYMQDRCPAGRLRLENVEKDGRVARLASTFFGFQEGEQNALEVTDGLAAVRERPAGEYDAVLVDCFAGQDRVPMGCRSEEFLGAARRLLKPDGVVAQNVWARSSASDLVAKEFGSIVEAYSSVFRHAPGREVVFDAPQSLQYIVSGVQGERWASLAGDD